MPYHISSDSRPGIVKLDNGETEGLDPRKMSISLLGECGHEAAPLLRVIREKCLDCSHTATEVRRCTSVGCWLWPYRMATNPFRPERTEAQKAASQANADRLRAYREKAE